MSQAADVRGAAPTYGDWVGREEERSEPISESAVRAMSATLGCEAVPARGEPLPPGWQWMFFNPVVTRSGLGADGHPQRGGFLPPIELPRRMWAGSRISYHQPVPVGAEAVRRSRIDKVEKKEGRSGVLWFVTVSHTIVCNGADCIVEQQDIVYREASPPGSAPARTPQPYTEVADWSAPCEPDTTLLFRYSALTFNGHRIHYDQSYARDVEGYRDLVVHGPLTATLLQQFALANNPGRQLKQFEFRGVSPLFVSRPFVLAGRAGKQDGELELWALGPDGELAMSATAVLR